MSGLDRLDRGLPPFAAVLVAAVAASTFAASAAVALSRGTGGSGPHGITNAARRSRPVAPTGAATPSNAAPAVVARGVAEALVRLQDGIARYKLVPDSIAGTGPVDVAAAAAINAGTATASAADVAALRDLGYVAGRSRIWDDGSRTVIVYGYAWRTDAAARAFAGGFAAAHARRHDAWRPALAATVGSCWRQGSDVVDTALVRARAYTFTIVVVRTGTCARHDAVLAVARLQQSRASQVVGG